MPVRWPQTSNCSMAAARKVSAAHSRTERRSLRKRCPSLPMVVVFPEPLTPTRRTTAGGSATRAGARSLAARISRSCSRVRAFRSPQFADGGGFSGAVDAHQKDHGGRFRDARGGTLAGGEDFEKLLADEGFQLGGVGQLVALYALADAFENLLGGAHADIGRQECGLEFLQQIGIDLLLARSEEHTSELQSL